MRARAAFMGRLHPRRYYFRACDNTEASGLQIESHGGASMSGCNSEFGQALDELVRGSEIVIDRPKGTARPRFPELIYQVDYGYRKDTASMDGAGIDVVGSGEKRIEAIM